VERWTELAGDCDEAITSCKAAVKALEQSELKLKAGVRAAEESRKTASESEARAKEAAAAETL
jgi:hypothetical protein